MSQYLSTLGYPKDLDPSYKTDLDFWDCFWKEKTASISQRKTVEKIVWERYVDLFPQENRYSMTNEITSCLRQVQTGNGQIRWHMLS